MTFAPFSQEGRGVRAFQCRFFSPLAKGVEPLPGPGPEELKWEPCVTATEIGVSVNNGDVTLRGTVPTFAEKFAAEQAGGGGASIILSAKSSPPGLLKALAGRGRRTRLGFPGQRVATPPDYPGAEPRPYPVGLPPPGSPC